MENSVNIMITLVSKYSGKTNPDLYVDEACQEYQGIMTNEAPIESVMNHLNEAGSKLDTLILIESTSVKNEKHAGFGEYDCKTSDQILMERLEAWCASTKIDMPISYVVDLADEPDASDAAKTVLCVYDKIKEYVSNPDQKVKIYAESNGGIRYVVMMLLSMLMSLESMHENLHIETVLSMVYGVTPTRIVNQKSIYGTARLTGIVNEFINYGRISGLNKYMDEWKDDLQADEKTAIYEMIGKLAKLSEDIQLCRTAVILKDLYENGGIREEIRQYKRRNHEGETVGAKIFSFLLDQIEKELEEPIYGGLTNEKLQDDDDIIKYLPKVIKWCLDKEFVQQALTLCAERLPKYIVLSGNMNLSRHDMWQNFKYDTKYEKNYELVTNLSSIFDGKNGMHLVEARQAVIYKKIMVKCGRDIRLLSFMQSCEEMAGDQTAEIGYIPPKEWEDIWNFAAEYLTNDNLDVDKMAQKHLKEKWSDWKEKTVHLSSQKSTNVIWALCGKYLDGGTPKDYKRTEGFDKNDRLKAVLPVITKELILNETRRETACLYERFVDGLIGISPELANKIKRAYAAKQGAKYYILDACRKGCIVGKDGQIMNENEMMRLQRILYLYSICKEQRNLANHANEDEEVLALDFSELKLVIITLLRELDA